MKSTFSSADKTRSSYAGDGIDRVDAAAGVISTEARGQAEANFGSSGEGGRITLGSAASEHQGCREQRFVGVSLYNVEEVRKKGSVFGAPRRTKRKKRNNRRNPSNSAIAVRANRRREKWRRLPTYQAREYATQRRDGRQLSATKRSPTFETGSCVNQGIARTANVASATTRGLNGRAFPTVGAGPTIMRCLWIGPLDDAQPA